VNRIEVAAVAGAMGWGIHLTHTGVSYVLWRLDDNFAAYLGGVYERLIPEETEV
jgi:hypothetical protein